MPGNYLAAVQLRMTSRAAVFCLVAVVFFAGGQGEEPAVCDAGYEAGEDGCVDINECRGSPRRCDISARCANTEGSFTCTCVAGYLGDGISCADAAWSVRTYVIWPDGDAAFTDAWDSIQGIYTNVVVNGENVETAESKLVASSAPRVSRPHGEYGSVAALHALFATEAEAAAGFSQLQQFGVGRLQGLLQPLLLAQDKKVAVLHPEIKKWFISTGANINVESGGMGLNVDNIEFKPGCGKTGCWVVDVSHLRPGSDTVVAFLPRAVGIAGESGPLTYESDVRSTFNQGAFPCAGGFGELGRGLTPCCLVDVVQSYRTTAEFEAWLGANEELQTKCNASGYAGPPPKSGVIPPGLLFESGLPAEMESSSLEAIANMSNNRIGIRFSLDDRELYSLAGIATHPEGVTRRIETFVGTARVQYGTEDIMTTVAEIATLRLDKTDYFFFTFAAKFEEEKPGNGKSARFNAELRLKKSEVCLPQDKLKQIVQDKVQKAAQKAASKFNRAVVSELEVRMMEGDCENVEAGGGGERRYQKYGSKASRTSGNKRGAVGPSAVGLREVEEEDALTYSEGSFLVLLEMADDAEESRINVAKFQSEIPGMMSLEPLESAVPVVIDNEFEPSQEVQASYDDAASQAQQNQDGQSNPARTPSSSNDPLDPNAGDDSGTGGGTSGFPALYVAMGLAVPGVIVAALLLYVRRASRSARREAVLPVDSAPTSPDTSFRAPLEQSANPKARRSSLMALLSGRKACMESTPPLTPTAAEEAVNLSFQQSIAVRDPNRKGSIVTGRRMSAVETEQAFRNNSSILQKAAQQDAVVLVAENSRRGSTFFNEFQTSGAVPESGDGLRVASSPDAKKRRRWSLPWQTVEPLDTSPVAAAQFVSAHNSPANRRGSIQVIALSADISRGDTHELQFGEVGLDEFMPGVGPSLAEPGQSLAFRPALAAPRRPAAPEAAKGAEPLSGP